MDLLKSRLSAMQSVLNAAARLFACLPRFTNISIYMTEVIHWLQIASRIKFEVLLLVFKSQLGLAPRYLITDFMCKPMSSTSADRSGLLVPRVRTALAQFIHSLFITEIYIAPLQGYYSEALPTLARLKRRVLRLE